MNPGRPEGLMTYCCGILVRNGLVMIADTRTNAGLDNISTFRKLHVFRDPGERIMALASGGNLSISQSVVSMLNDGDPAPALRHPVLTPTRVYRSLTA
jgi:putative proteasome-type protease